MRKVESIAVAENHLIGSATLGKVPPKGRFAPQSALHGCFNGSDGPKK